jgi:hypothetical protein
MSRKTRIMPCTLTIDAPGLWAIRAGLFVNSTPLLDYGQASFSFARSTPLLDYGQASFSFARSTPLLGILPPRHTVHPVHKSHDLVCAGHGF